MSGKEEAIRVRVTPDMRAQLDLIAAHRGESVSVVIRDALREYLALGAPNPGPAAKAAALNETGRRAPAGSERLAEQIAYHHATQILARGQQRSGADGEPAPSSVEASTPPPQPPTVRRKPR